MPSERRADPKSGRRRWQLRLRTLLLFVTLLSCGLAYWTSEVRALPGARLPAETFEHLPSFSKLRAGIVWGLQLPDHSKSLLVRFHETTGGRLH